MSVAGRVTVSCSALDAASGHASGNTFFYSCTAEPSRALRSCDGRTVQAERWRRRLCCPQLMPPTRAIRSVRPPAGHGCTAVSAPIRRTVDVLYTQRHDTTQTSARAHVRDTLRATQNPSRSFGSTAVARVRAVSCCLLLSDVHTPPTDLGRAGRLQDHVTITSGRAQRSDFIVYCVAGCIPPI